MRGKGVSNYLIWMVVLLIVTLIVIALFYFGGINIIRDVLKWKLP